MPLPSVSRLSRSFPAGDVICVAALAVALAGASHASAQSPPPPLQRDGVWAQTYSDLPADPAIRFGQLPNGFRYALMRNETPTHQASMRLWIGSGSMEESADEQGLAHFLEHMAFRGSAHVPNGDMVKILERHGLAFGADTNAETGFTETVYQLDLPETDKDSLGVGLMLMRDIASELTLSQTAMDAERGVVLSEERLRDTPDFEASAKQLFAFDFQGQLAADRLPIGKVEVIQHAPASLLRRFYDANYRPDRAALVVVGDIDPAAMEQEIKARFGGWKPVGPETPTPDYGRPEQRGVETHLYVHDGVTPSINISWMAPYDAAADTAEKERRDLVRMIALQALNRRFQRLADAADPPFMSAAVERENEVHSAEVGTLEINFQPAKWRDALTAAIDAQRQALSFGLRQDEVDREVTELRVRFRNAVAGASTRRTPDLANDIVRNLDEDGVQTSPQQDLITFETAVKGLTAAQATDVLRQAFTGQGPLLTMATPQAPAGGEAEVAAAFAAAETAPLVAATDHATKTWTHAQFGAAGQVVERRDIADLGVTFVRFANGVRLTIKLTTFRKDQTYVAIHFNHGRLALPKDRDSATWLMRGFVQGGLNDLTYDDVQQVLASKTVSIDLGLGDDSFALEGLTRPQDLATELQLLTAYMTAPGWRPEAFEQVRAGAGVALAQMSSTPEGVEGRDLGQLEHSGDDRWRVPTAQEAKTQAIAPFKAMLGQALATGPVEVEIVGDVTVPQAIALTATTLGALPPRPAAPIAPGEDVVRFPSPSPTPIVRRHDGRADQAIGYIAWPIPDLFSDPQRARALTVASEVMASRLIDQLRVAQGATYSPQAGAVASETFPGYGYAFATVETPPQKLDGFYAAVAQITQSLATTGVTPDAFERARKPHVDALIKARQTNEFWVTRLEGAQTDPRRLALIREMIPGYAKLTPKDIQDVAATYFTGAKAWKFEVVPAGAAAK
jgi:zinc protease